MTEPSGHPNGQYEGPSDEELLARIRDAHSPAEKRDAWEPLLVRYQPLIHGLCRQMLGPRGAIEDACQDALVRVMRGIDSFDGKAKLSTWIYRVTMNSCLSRLRKDNRRKARVVSGNAPTGSKQGSDGPASMLTDLLPQYREPIGASRVEREDQRDLVIEALGRLDPDLRSVLLLRDAQGLDYAQIAELLEVRVGTIKSRIFRARLALRQVVESVRAERLGPNELAERDED
ncbi:MAG: RNA polymerase sigma factor SigM [Phycisphaerales bacterium]